MVPQAVLATETGLPAGLGRLWRLFLRFLAPLAILAILIWG